MQSTWIHITQISFKLINFQSRIIFWQKLSDWNFKEKNTHFSQGNRVLDKPLLNGLLVSFDFFFLSVLEVSTTSCPLVAQLHIFFSLWHMSIFLSPVPFFNYLNTVFIYLFLLFILLILLLFFLLLLLFF